MRAVQAVKDGSNQQEGSPIGNPYSQVDVFLEALSPLIKFACSQLCSSKLDNPAAIVAVRLLEQCGAPEDALSATRSWLNACPFEPSPPAARRPDGDSPKKDKARVNQKEKARVSLKKVDDGHGRDVTPMPSLMNDEGSSGKLQVSEIQVSVGSPSSRESKKAKNPSVVWSGGDGGLEQTDHDMAQEVFQRNEKKRMTALPNAAPAAEGAKDQKLDSRRRRFTVAHQGKVAQVLPDEDELLDLFKKVPSLSKLGDDDLRKAIKIAKCQQFDTDQPIVPLGSKADELHFVLEGTAGVAIPHYTHTLLEGQFFGNENLLLTDNQTVEHYYAIGGPITTVSLSAVEFDKLHITKNHVSKAGGNRMARNLADLGKARDGIQDGICQSTGFRVVDDYVQTDMDVAMIQGAVRNNNVLGDVLQLSESQYQKIVEFVYLVLVRRDETCIERGSRGSNMFIVQEGLLDVTLEAGKQGEFKIRPGDAFGELGLLYDAPRAATVTAVTDCKVWVLRRSDFQAVMRSEHKAQTAEHRDVLKKIPVLTKQVAEHNIDLVADMLEEMLLLESEEVCRAGEDPGQLFIVMDGRCEIRNMDEETIGTLGKGEWIGEKQLEEKIEAEYTVRVVSETAVVLSLDNPGLHMALATAAGLESSALLTDSGKDNSAEKQRQAHNLIDISLKKALKSYENCHRSGGEDEIPSLQSCITCGGLGEGSFGLVYLTEHVATKKVYALKVVSKRHIIEEQLSNMMKNERDVMMLLDSDFVVRLYRAYHDDISIYLLLELVTGGELFDVYHDGDLFCNLPVARFYFACVIMGLEHLHEKRVIYRDLKMENCLLDSTGYVKLTDMGIAKVVVGKTYTVCGTADYLAPETLRQLGHNRAVDWWACGVLLFIMCSGRSPFDAMDVQQIYKNIIKGFSKVKFPDTFPSDLVDVVKSLGRKKPEERLTMQKGGVENLRELPYFSGLDWWSLASRELAAPCVPEPLNREKVAAKKLSKEVDVSSPEISEWDGSMNCRDLGSKESAMPPEATS